MEYQHIITIILTFVIHLIGTLSYAVRIVGVRTKKVALTLSLFNILVIVSRMANTFQAPLIANIVEKDIISNVTTRQNGFFMTVILASTLGTFAGIILTPTFQRILTIAVEDFSINKSVLNIIRRLFRISSWRMINKEITMPSKKNLDFKSIAHYVSYRYIFLNLFATSILTIGVLSAIYAGYLNPDFRTTASNLSSVINGFATVFMLIFLDPYLSIMVDESVHGKMPEWIFRRYMVLLLFSRLFGTLLAQLVFFPAAYFISWIVELL